MSEIFFEGLYNTEIESGILGTLLADPDAIDIVSQHITEQDFFHETNALLYSQIKALIHQHGAVSAAMLAGTSADQEFRAYVGQLLTAATIRQSIPGYAKTLRQLAMRRRLAVACKDIGDQTRALAPSDDVGPLVDAAEAAIYGVSVSGSVSHNAERADAIVNDLLTEVGLAMQRGTGLAGISTGFSSLDEALGGLAPETLNLLCGRPGAGKTALATNMAAAAARRGDPVLFFSLEMSKKQLVARFISQELEINGSRIRKGDFLDKEFNDLITRARGISWLKNIHIDACPGATIQSLVMKARRAVRKNGVKLVIIDYLQLAKSEGFKSGADSVQQIESIAYGAKEMAMTLGIPVIGLTQLNRQIEGKGEKDRSPRMSDLKGGGGLEQAADSICILTNDADENDSFAAPQSVSAHIVKNRHSKTCVVPLMAEMQFGRFVSARDG